MSRNVYTLPETQQRLFLNPAAGSGILIIDETPQEKPGKFQPHFEFQQNGKPRLFCYQHPSIVGPEFMSNGVRWVPLSRNYPGWGELYASQEFNPADSSHATIYLQGIETTQLLLEHIRKAAPENTRDIEALEKICSQAQN